MHFISETFTMWHNWDEKGGHKYISVGKKKKKECKITGFHKALNNMAETLIAWHHGKMTNCLAVELLEPRLRWIRLSIPHKAHKVFISGTTAWNSSQCFNSECQNFQDSFKIFQEVSHFSLASHTLAASVVFWIFLRVSCF